MKCDAHPAEHVVFRVLCLPALFHEIIDFL